MNEPNRDVPYPGHTVFVESFLLCTIKNVGDISEPGDLYVETAVDGNSGMAFARIYSAANAMNAVDLLASRVLPFFKHYGVAIERVFTRNSHEYCGLAPDHPFETFLSGSQIQHLQGGSSEPSVASPCGKFCQILREAFLAKALRKRFQQSLTALQQDLDDFVEIYNSTRVNPGLDRPPFRIFLDNALT